MNRPHINLTMLRVLDALERERNYTRAGERLGLTQSGVSHAVRALEEAVGGSVIERRGRAAELTALGETALLEARAVLGHLDRLRALREREPVAGQVRLGAVRSAAAAILPEVLDVVRRRHPDVGVELLEGSDREVLEWIRGGAVDLGIGMERGDLEAVRLCDSPMQLVVAEGHPLADEAAVSWSALDRLTFVMSGSGCEPSILAAAESAGVALDVVLRVQDTQALLAMVRAGIGISVLPALATVGLGDAVAVRDLVPRLVRTLWMVSGNTPPDAATTALGRAIRNVSAAR